MMKWPQPAAVPPWTVVAMVRSVGAAGYYDQAHLIAEFRAIAGVTPGALLSELGDAAWR